MARHAPPAPRLKRASPRDRIAPVTPQPLATLLLGVGLAVLCLTAPAWAHPGHELDGRSRAASTGSIGQPDRRRKSRGAAHSWETLRRHAPTSVGAARGGAVSPGDHAAPPAGARSRRWCCRSRLSRSRACSMRPCTCTMSGMRTASRSAHPRRNRRQPTRTPTSPSATPVILLSEVVERLRHSRSRSCCLVQSRTRSSPLSRLAFSFPEPADPVIGSCGRSSSHRSSSAGELSA